MPKLYKDYCYETVNEVRLQVLSNPILMDGSIVQSAVMNSGNIDVVTDTKSFTLNPPNCTNVGYTKTWFGLSFADAQETTWLVAAVLVTAFSIKVLKRVL